MTHLIRHCAGCGRERPFEQFHADPASCPDVPDGDCAEWGCIVCGEALITGLLPGRRATGEDTSRAA
ncbi:MAG TPA: hypothetical protein VKV35_08755 [Streptosporangiaceae bacterium]|nr:hypothetical protein [Streptosporangiaceae bacterium]